MDIFVLTISAGLFADSLLDKIGFESCRIFLTGQNLKIWTDYEDMTW